MNTLFKNMDQHNGGKKKEVAKSAATSDASPSSSAASSNSTQRSLFVVHTNIVVYAFCYWVTSPSMPFLMKEYGATSLSFGYFSSLFNLVQLVGGLTVGNLQDRYSGSAAMNITQLGSLAVYLLVLFATNLNMLYFSRIPTILQQSMQVAQAFISKNTPEESRSMALSRISISYGIGMVAGGFIHGPITTYFHSHAPFVLAAGLTTVMLFVNAGVLESESLKKRSTTVKKSSSASAKEDEKDEKNTPVGFSYGTIIRKVYPVLVFLLFLFATRSLFESVYNLTLIEQFGIQQTQMGSLLSFMAVISSVSNIVILPLALKFLGGEDNVTKCSLFGSALAYVGTSVAVTMHVPVAEGELDIVKYAYLGCLGLLSVFSTALYTTSTSYISKQTDKSLHGQSVALSHALRSAVGIVCPILSTWMYSNFGGQAVALLNSGLLVLALVMYKSDRSGSSKKKQKAE